MCRKNKEANSHWRIGLLKAFMFTIEKLLKGNKIVQTLTHFLPIDSNHIVVHPVTNHLIALTCYGLCNFAFVVREYQIHATAMNIKVTSQVFSAHSCTLTVPPGEAFAPRTWPVHDMFGLCFFPKRKVLRIAFFSLPI